MMLPKFSIKWLSWFSGLLFALMTATAGAQTARKPNILIIWGDDIGQFNVGAYNMGMMGYKTPNIDRIGRTAKIAVFRQCNRQANQSKVIHGPPS